MRQTPTQALFRSREIMEISRELRTILLVRRLSFLKKGLLEMITDHVEQVTLCEVLLDQRTSGCFLETAHAKTTRYSGFKISAYVKHDFTNRSNIVLELDLCIENFYEIIFLFSSLK